MEDVQQLIILFDGKQPRLGILTSCEQATQIIEETTEHVVAKKVTHEKILDRHQHILKHMKGIIPLYIIDHFVVSPLWLVNQAKRIIISLMKPLMQKPITIDPKDLLIWSYETNIEYLGNRIFRYEDRGDKQFIHNEGLMFSKFPYERLSLNVTWLGNSELSFLNTNNINITDTFIVNHCRLFSLQRTMKLDSEIKTSNIFSSIYSVADYTVIKKTISADQSATMFIKSNNRLLMTGRVRVLPDLQLFNEFMIIVENTKGDSVVITEKNIFVSDLDLFKKLFLNMSSQKNYVLPERYSSRARYIYNIPEIIKSSIEDFPDADQYFIASSSMKNVMNIINSIDKSVQILLAKHSVRVELRYINNSLAEYIATLIYALNISNHYEEEGYTFGRVNGQYWSRICQNLNGKKRQPIKINPQDKLRASLDTNKFHIDKNSESIVIPYGNSNIYLECNKETHHDAHHIGFISKFYSDNKTCWPCCYLNNHVDSKLFKNCINGQKADIRVSYSLFLLDSNKQLGEERLGFLPGPLDRLLNKSSELKYIDKNKRLIATDGFYFACGTGSIKIEDTLYDFFRLSINNDKIIYDNGVLIYTPHVAVNNSLWVYIKEHLYPVVKVIKKSNEDRVNTTNTGLSSDILIKSMFKLQSRSDSIIDIDNYIEIALTEDKLISNEEYMLEEEQTSENFNITYLFNTDSYRSS